ncbi:MAG: hypothetical protein COA78_12030 [Blastopirellula sp.]|nr:MAG: hypothetical protein COA78_12030 [Blastopirellula sp.]
MFKLNELIILKESIETSLSIMDEFIRETHNKELKALRTERFTTLLTLYKKVDYQSIVRANFDGEENDA